MALHRLRLRGEKRLATANSPWASLGDLGDEVLESSGRRVKILFRERLDSMWWQDAEGVGDS